MKLDSRIKDILYIADCFTTDNYQKYVGTECYFSDEISRFSDLDKCTKTTLAAIYENNALPYVANNRSFKFCLASVFVEQKQTELRPFTLSEFTEKFPVGQPIKFRKKGMVEYELYLILLGYRGHQYNGKAIPNIYIGYSTPFTLDELFDDYEWLDPATGDWMPFGVEE